MNEPNPTPTKGPNRYANALDDNGQPIRTLIPLAQLIARMAVEYAAYRTFDDLGEADNDNGEAIDWATFIDLYGADVIIAVEAVDPNQTMYAGKA